MIRLVILVSWIGFCGALLALPETQLAAVGQGVCVLGYLAQSPTLPKLSCWHLDWMKLKPLSPNDFPEDFPQDPPSVILGAGLNGFCLIHRKQVYCWHPFPREYGEENFLFAKNPFPSTEKIEGIAIDKWGDVCGWHSDRSVHCVGPVRRSGSGWKMEYDTPLPAELALARGESGQISVSNGVVCSLTADSRVRCFATTPSWVEWADRATAEHRSECARKIEGGAPKDLKEAQGLQIAVGEFHCEANVRDGDRFLRWSDRDDKAETFLLPPADEKRDDSPVDEANAFFVPRLRKHFLNLDDLWYLAQGVVWRKSLQAGLSFERGLYYSKPDPILLERMSDEDVQNTRRNYSKRSMIGIDERNLTLYDEVGHVDIQVPHPFVLPRFELETLPDMLHRMSKIVYRTKAQVLSKIADLLTALPEDQPTRKTDVLFIWNALSPYLQAIDSEIVTREILPSYRDLLAIHNSHYGRSQLSDWHEPSSVLLSLRVLEALLPELEQAMPKSPRTDSLRLALAQALAERGSARATRDLGKAGLLLANEMIGGPNDGARDCVVALSKYWSTF